MGTLPVIDRELNPKEDPSAPVEIICDMYGPDSPPADLVPDAASHNARPLTYEDWRS